MRCYQKLHITTIVTSPPNKGHDTPTTRGNAKYPVVPHIGYEKTKIGLLAEAPNGLSLTPARSAC